ncbi:hypothetical protein EU523_01545 [Candidatus Heimdallarchaeota archaeon]|nr:MAG: hypothetical protein EU523_01545 [Candidatus Heimdallarchaeota archaeon]
MTRFKIPNLHDKRAKKGLRKQIISIFLIVADEMGPHVESIASPYPSESYFNDNEISMLFTTVTMFEVKEMLFGELKLIFEIIDFTMDDGRPSKKVLVAVCGWEANSNQVRDILHNLLSSSNAAIKNLENIMKK